MEDGGCLAETEAPDAIIIAVGSKMFRRAATM
jgi:hypothetical protein